VGDLVAIMGVSGVGKTALVSALAKTGQFATAFEQHEERPFQALFKADPHYALANQIDYYLFRADQEKALRSHPLGLLDGGLDLDFHGFTRLFHSRGLLTDPEFDLCRRLYIQLRENLPAPEWIIAMHAPGSVIKERLASRNRINIASADDAEIMERFIGTWLETLPSSRILQVDASREDETYAESVQKIIKWVNTTDRRD
jgi:deoxyadenosine/deoxycytidine kinase